MAPRPGRWVACQAAAAPFGLSGVDLFFPRSAASQGLAQALPLAWIPQRCMRPRRDMIPMRQSYSTTTATSLSTITTTIPLEARACMIPSTPPNAELEL